VEHIPKITLHFIDQRPKEAARVLEKLSPEITASLLEHIPISSGIKFFEKLLPEYSAQCLKKLSPDLAAAYLKEFSSASCLPLIRLISKKYKEAFFAHLPEDQAQKLANQLTYPKNTVGAIMNADPIEIPNNLTIGEARKYLRRMAKKIESIGFVKDEENSLCGLVYLANFAISKDSLPIQKLTLDDAPKISDKLTLKKANKLPDWNRFEILPVVDKGGKLIGSLRKNQLNHALFQIEDKKKNHNKISKTLKSIKKWPSKFLRKLKSKASTLKPNKIINP